MSRNNDTYSMLDTRDWTRDQHVSHISQKQSDEYDLKYLDNDWHNLLQRHLRGT